MNEIFLIVAFVVVFISVVMVVYNWRTNKNSIYLAAFLIILSLEGLSTWLFYSKSYTFLYAILLNQIAPFFTLKAPLLYFFVRGNLRDNFTLNKTDWWHFLPAIMHFLVIIPYILTPFSHKFQIAQTLQNYPHLYPGIDLGYPYPHILNHYFRAIQLVVYSAISIVMIVHFMSGTSAFSGELRRQYRFSSTWLVLFLSLITGVGIMHLFTIDQARLETDYVQAVERANRLFSATISIYAFIPMVLIAYPRFLYGFPAFKSNKESGFFSSDTEPTTNCEPRLYPRKVLQNIDELYQRITEYMETEKPFLNKEFKLTDLSLALNVPVHHLQLCISQKTEKKFADFKNTYRIDFATQLMLQPNRLYTLEAIGELAGFASNSNFYEAFRIAKGTTPRQWYIENEENNKVTTEELNIENHE